MTDSFKILYECKAENLSCVVLEQIIGKREAGNPILNTESKTESAIFFV